MANDHGRFVWYELITTDTECAKAFYPNVLGWGTQEVSMPGMAYNLFTLGESSVSGLVNLPTLAEEVGAKPHWIGYVAVHDVDATAALINQLGGVVHIPPMDFPHYSRFAVPRVARAARRLIAVSEFTRGEIVELLGVP